MSGGTLTATNQNSSAMNIHLRFQGTGISVDDYTKTVTQKKKTTFKSNHIQKQHYDMNSFIVHNCISEQTSTDSTSNISSSSLKRDGRS